tara:strand:+ start:2143 stop:3411 length:1269 start_codon:yes stop_codon:yes gene_type:complete
MEQKQVIPTGSKETKIGVIPRDWEVKKISDIAYINPKKSILSEDTKVSFVAMNDVSSHLRSHTFIIKSASDVMQGFTSFINDDVILAKITPCFENGKVAHVSNLVNGVGFGSTEFHVLRAKMQTSSMYLYYIVKLDSFRKRCISNMQGSSGHRRVPKDFISAYKIQIPELQEQQKIAKILSTWDRAIEQTQALLEQSKLQKKYLMQQLLTGKKRLLDGDEEKFFNDWKEKKLSQVLDVNPKKNIKPQNGYVSFISMDNLYSSSRKYNSVIKDYDSVSSGFTSFINDDVILAKITPCFENGKCIHVNNLENGIGFGSTEFHILRAHNENDSTYIYYLVNSYVFRTKCISNMQGSSGHKRVPKDFICLYKTYIPNFAEQKKIASVLTTADQEIEQLEKQIEAYEQEKKYLMQQLLTGKTRVPLN